MTHVTVRSTKSRGDGPDLSPGFMNEISSYSDLCGESTHAPAYGFCDSLNCKTRVKGDGTNDIVFTIRQSQWGYITANHDINDCRHCGQALYWSNKYTTTPLDIYKQQQRERD